MDNQHRKIKGYRELTEVEIANMNKVKELGIKIGELADDLRNARSTDGRMVHDQRWINIGATDMQKGLMALTRSIDRPDFF